MNTDKICALTFDDGPSLTTPRVLDVLESYGILASFFLEGEHIIPETIPIMKRALSLGCELHNHSWSHPHIGSISEDAIRGEVSRTSAAIKNAVGVEPRFLRPPYLETSDALTRSAVLPMIGGIPCEDWDDSVSPETRSEKILSAIESGAVILMHDMDGNWRTVEALGLLIPRLLADGYRFVTIGGLFRERNVNPDVPGKLWTIV